MTTEKLELSYPPHLFVVRHEKESNLRNKRLDNVHALADSIAKRYEGLERHIYLLTSHEFRAVATGKILADDLGINVNSEIDRYVALCGSEESGIGLKDVDQSLKERSQNSNGLVLVGHLPFMREYLPFIMKEEMGIDVTFESDTFVEKDYQNRFFAKRDGKKEIFWMPAEASGYYFDLSKKQYESI